MISKHTKSRARPQGLLGLLTNWWKRRADDWDKAMEPIQTWKVHAVLADVSRPKRLLASPCASKASPHDMSGLYWRCPCLNVCRIVTLDSAILAQPEGHSAGCQDVILEITASQQREAEIDEWWYRLRNLDATWCNYRVAVSTHYSLPSMLEGLQSRWLPLAGSNHACHSVLAPKRLTPKISYSHCTTLPGAEVWPSWLQPWGRH